MGDYVFVVRGNMLSNKCGKNDRLLVLIFSVVFIVVLFLSLFVVYELSLSVVGGGGGVVFVGSEGELERVVNNVWWRWGRSVVVALNRDVVLSKPLVISDGRHVTLTSNVAVGDGFFRLVGADNEPVVFVGEGGWLCVDGVVVTHEVGVKGGGVVVRVGGEFVLVSGKISGNTIANGTYGGGGVYNLGVFRMFGGEISNNNALESYGYSYSHGAVYSPGRGGGVYNGDEGVFELFGGLITNNVAMAGGGVYNRGNFTMSGGSITKNTSKYSDTNKVQYYESWGGGVGNNNGVFIMSGGLITQNIARANYGGGVYGSSGGVYGSSGGGVVVFEGGEVVNNVCKIGEGNDIYVVGKDGTVVLVR